METDKLLVRIGTARDSISRKTEQTSLDYMIDGVLMNCSVLLKEQKERIGVLERTIEHMPKSVTLLDAFGNNYARIVRCKDCMHRGHCELQDGFGKSADWFCADGEKGANTL